MLRRCFAGGWRKPRPTRTVEKYLKALLTRHQIEFPNTHDIKTLLNLVGSVSGPATDSVAAPKWLTPYGVEFRHPADAQEMLPGDETKAIEIAGGVKTARACDVRQLLRA